MIPGNTAQSQRVFAGARLARTKCATHRTFARKTAAARANFFQKKCGPSRVISDHHGSSRFISVHRGSWPPCAFFKNPYLEKCASRRAVRPFHYSSARFSSGAFSEVPMSGLVTTTVVCRCHPERSEGSQPHGIGDGCAGKFVADSCRLRSFGLRPQDDNDKNRGVTP